MDVVATTSHGDILTGLKRENFRLSEDGVPQTVTNFGPTDAPITMVIVMEFSARYYSQFSYLAKYWTDAFVPEFKAAGLRGAGDVRHEAQNGSGFHAK